MSELNRREAAWIRKLQNVLDECPSDRIGFYTIGDSDVTLYDRTKEKDINDAIYDRHGGDFCQAVDDADAGFNACLLFPANVHSTSG
jgi:hypothetical protein